MSIKLKDQTIVAENEKSVGPNAGSWQSILKSAYRDPADVCQALELPPDLALKTEVGQQAFRLFCPEPFLQKMQVGDRRDPLFLQIWPSEKEADVAGQPLDVLNESTFEVTPGLIQKYDKRSLMISTGACAIHCRYCFRRNFPYQEAPKSALAWEPAFQKLEGDPTIEEVILSGGDPWTLTDQFLSQLLDRIESIPAIRRVRVHTRLPIVIPQRVTQGLCEIFRDRSFASIIVVHSNHPNEIGPDVEASLQELGRNGFLLLNQSVLLRGVNDHPDVLLALSKKLVAAGVTPYYLHQLDPIAGVRHFEVSIEEGRRIVDAMRKSESGYLVPRYVQERPGADSKTLLS